MFLHKDRESRCLRQAGQKDDLRFPGSRAYIVGMGETHQHGHAHAHAQEHPAESGRMTPGRQRVLDLLTREGRPVGAYELIDLLGVETGRRPAPISVYRALDFLVEAGRVHRLASRNAFLACGHAHDAHQPVAFLICDSCGQVAERTSDALARDVGDLTRAAGFKARAQIIEIAGRCSDCGDPSPKAGS